MKRIFKNISRIEQNKGEPGQKSEPTQDRQNRTHPPVTLDHGNRQRGACPSIPPDPEAEPSLIQEEQHHDRVKDAVHQPKIRKQLSIDQRILHSLIRKDMADVRHSGIRPDTP